MATTIDLSDIAKVVAGYQAFVERKMKAKDYAKSYYEKNKDGLKKKSNEYYTNNKDKVLEKQKRKYDTVRKKNKNDDNMKIVSLENFMETSTSE
jgi:hypothetical protein